MTSAAQQAVKDCETIQAFIRYEANHLREPKFKCLSCGQGALDVREDALLSALMLAVERLREYATGNCQFPSWAQGTLSQVLERLNGVN